MDSDSSIVVNSHARSSGPVAGFFSPAALERVKQDISAWPGYRPSPLIELEEVAASSRVKAVLYKDESGRFGQGSFKALGGSYAVQRLVEQKAREMHGRTFSVAQILADRLGPSTRLTVACATDGNHGRSVAWAARMFGLPCFVYVHANVSAPRRRALEDLGANVVQVEGVYDDAVRRAAADADMNGWTVVSDTSYPGYTVIPADVMLGYTMMLDEVLAQSPYGITHVFVQCGVGALPAAVCAYFAARSPSTRTIVVEPERAACLMESARQRRIVNLEGDLATVMAGLACGHPSHLAWDILGAGAAAFLTAPEESAIHAMRLLARRSPPVEAGETGAAGLAGFLVATRGPRRALCGLDAESVVLVIGTEGATDPDLYERIMRLNDDEVAGFCRSFIDAARRNATAGAPGRAPAQLSGT